MVLISRKIWSGIFGKPRDFALCSLKRGCSEDQPLAKDREIAIMGAMYLRRTEKKKGGADYDCWLLVESIRTARGPRQRVVATIGKLPGLDREERIGWEEISRILSGKPRPTLDLFEQREEPPSGPWSTSRG
jgi:hypothetical protein